MPTATQPPPPATHGISITDDQVIKAAHELGYALCEHATEPYFTAKFQHEATGAVRFARMHRDKRGARHSACQAFAAYHLLSVAL